MQAPLRKIVIVALVWGLQTTTGAEIEAIDRAVHGALAGDELEYSDNRPDIFPPADSPLVAPNSQWELDAQEATLPAAEQVDEWEAIPLPVQAEQLQQDSEAVGKEGTQARREVEELSAQIAKALDEMGRVEFIREVEEREEGPLSEGSPPEELSNGRKQPKVALDAIAIFNTDDFDGQESDEHDDPHNYL